MVFKFFWRGFGNGDIDAAEVIEHVFHTIHMSGLDALALKTIFMNFHQIGQVDLYMPP